MEIFDVIIGIATILNCIISFIALTKVNSINKKINTDQKIEKSNVNNSKIIQSGRDTQFRGND